MNDLRTRFERLQALTMELSDFIASHHASGIDFGTGDKLFPSEIHTVVGIGQNPGMNVTELAEKLNITKPTVSQRISKLVGKNLVEKGRLPGNSKTVVLTLTEKGLAAMQGHEEHHRKMFDSFVNKTGQDAERMIDTFTGVIVEYLQLLKSFGKDGLK